MELVEHYIDTAQMWLDRARIDGDPNGAKLYQAHKYLTYALQTLEKCMKGDTHD